MKNHELHKAVGNAFKAIIQPLSEFKLELDEACDDSIATKKHLPFFLSINAHNDTEITNVDIMLVKDNSVKLICEIEESDISPNRTYGKVFSAATAIMCRLKNKTRFDVDKNGIFVQVLSSKSLIKKDSKKVNQGKNIEKAINAILKSNCSWIKEYHLFYGEVNDFDFNKNGYIFLRDVINK